MASPSTRVDVPRTSRRLMPRIVFAASRSASRAASPQLLSDTPSSSIVFMTAMLAYSQSAGAAGAAGRLIIVKASARGEPTASFTEDELLAAIRRVLSGQGP